MEFENERVGHPVVGRSLLVVSRKDIDLLVEGGRFPQAAAGWYVLMDYDPGEAAAAKVEGRWYLPVYHLFASRRHFEGVFDVEYDGETVFVKGERHEQAR